MNDPSQIDIGAASTVADPSGVRIAEALSSSVPPAGTLIDGIYRVEGALGQGAMGMVLRARDLVLERDVAIKLIRPALVDDAWLRAQFLTEARAMARVNHPNVLSVYAFGELDGAPYIVMELVVGRSLESWMLARAAEGARPDVDTVVRLLEQVCLGVQAIHDARTVHRDLKPSNVLLDADFRVRVADLGLADLVRRSSGKKNGTVVGTPAYIAPEVSLEDDVEPELIPRADVYSLGCLAYQLLTGRAPFQGKTVLATLLEHVTKAPTPPTALRPDLSPAFDAVILRALAKKPADRTPTAEAFRRELVAARDEPASPVRILVADDDDDFRELLAALLDEEFPSAEVESVRNGAEALAAFDARRHSVVVVDLRMPKIDGLELTALLRARAWASSVPIIVLTGEGGAHEWQRLSEIGADGFLVKPVKPADVVTLVRRTLGERASGSAA